MSNPPTRKLLPKQSMSLDKNLNQKRRNPIPTNWIVCLNGGKWKTVWTGFCVHRGQIENGLHRTMTQFDGN